MAGAMKKVSLAEKFGLFGEYWQPKIVAELNENYVKVVKFKGEFVWHKHDEEDELFLITKGTMLIRFRDGDVEVGEGEFIVVPKGVEHKPVAAEEVHAVLIEPKTVLNTGDVEDSLTLRDLERI